MDMNKIKNVSIIFEINFIYFLFYYNFNFYYSSFFDIIIY